MGQDALRPLILNLGCGADKTPGMVNVDIDPQFCPDVLTDLTVYPWPWKDVNGIVCSHVLEHIPDWWSFFRECVRVTRPGGYIHITVPDYADLVSMTVRTHIHVFSTQTFKNRVHGIKDPHIEGKQNTADFLPVRLVDYQRVTHKNRIRWWMTEGVMRWIMAHSTGFFIEQKFEFVKL